MSKDKHQESSTELTSVQERIKARLESVDETTQQATGQNISVKGSIFRLPNGQTSAGPLNCIILDYVNKNMWYEEDYIEGEFIEPTCYAIARNIVDLKPHTSVEKPIYNNCKECPKNEWESGRGRGKACSNNVLLAILPDDFTEDSEVFTIKASATALKGWSNYVRELKAMNVDPVQVITSLSFQSGLSYPSLQFKHAGGNERLEEVNSFLPQADTLLRT